MNVDDVMSDLAKAQVEINILLTGLRRIESLGRDNVLKYAQSIATDTIRMLDGGRSTSDDGELL